MEACCDLSGLRSIRCHLMIFLPNVAFTWPSPIICMTSCFIFLLVIFIISSDLFTSWFIYFPPSLKFLWHLYQHLVCDGDSTIMQRVIYLFNILFHSGFNRLLKTSNLSSYSFCYFMQKCHFEHLRGCYFLKKLNEVLPYDSATLLIHIYPKEMKICLHKS